MQLDPEKRADILMARKMYREAVEVYKAGAAGFGDHLEQDRHRLSPDVADWNAAKKYYEKAIKIDSEVRRGHQQSGHGILLPEELSQGHQPVLPAGAEAFAGLGFDLQQPGHRRYFARKKYKEAAEAYQTALSLDQDVFEHHSTYGVLLEERSVRSAPSFTTTWRSTYAKAGQNERALQYIRKALEEGFKDKKKLMEDPGVRDDLRETAGIQGSDGAGAACSLRERASGLQFSFRCCSSMPASKANGPCRR